MDSAGAATAVVTPPGDTPTPPGGTDVEGLAPPVEDVDGVPDDGVGSVLDEHPGRIARPAAAAQRK